MSDAKDRPEASAQQLNTPGGNALSVPTCYDLYSEFGCALGCHPSLPDEALKELKVAILPSQVANFTTTAQAPT